MRRLFEDVMRTEFGVLTPEQHKTIREESEAAARARTREAPKFGTVMGDVPLDPAAAIPVVELDLGQMSAIAFIDQTGQPWPIASCLWSAGFEGEKPPPGSHILVIRATSQVEHGSVVCVMQGLTTPARLRLEAGNRRHHLGFDARIARLGPNAKPPPYDLGGGHMVAGDDVLSAFLYGVPPAGAEAIDVAGAGASTKAWRFEDDLYVRSSMVLLSPQPRAEARRESVHVYRMGPAPVLVFDDGGRDVEVRVPGARVVRARIPGDVHGSRDRPPVLGARYVGRDLVTGGRGGVP